MTESENKQLMAYKSFFDAVYAENNNPNTPWSDKINSLMFNLDMQLEIIYRNTKCVATPPKPPVGPPCRTYKETLFSGLIETEESKRATNEWRISSDQW